MQKKLHIKDKAAVHSLGITARQTNIFGSCEGVKMVEGNSIGSQ